MCFLPGIIHKLINISIKLTVTSGMFLYVHNKTVNNVHFCVIEAHCSYLTCVLGFSGGSVGKESACNAGDAGRREFDLRVGKIPWRRAWQPLLYSCLETPMGRGAWWAQSISDWAVCVSRVISIHCRPLKRIKTKNEHMRQSIFKVFLKKPGLM